jgi:S-adenosylmethionine:tRNA ribosyltransferase-isomerase
MRADLFDYELPPGLIAQRPLRRRDASRLLVLERESGRVVHGRFAELAGFLREGDIAVFNRSRVRRARLTGKLKGGGKAELLLLKPLDGEALRWEALGRPARRLRPGDRVKVAEGRLEAEVLENLGGGELRVELVMPREADPEELIEELGKVPLPPYIKEELADPERYQTVFADSIGSAAAPTAGLHFTAEMMDALRERGVETGFLDLRIGLDTFRPLQEGEVEGHPIHAEEMEVSEELCLAVNRVRAGGGRVLAVGTTVVRALETAWRDGELRPFRGATDLFIYPGYAFRCVDLLLTNLHLPRSTLLVLVCAFAGRDEVLAAYREAVRRGYRFFSFGDAMLII